YHFHMVSHEFACGKINAVTDDSSCLNMLILYISKLNRISVMNKIVIFDNKSHDTDTIYSALVYADLMLTLDVDADAVRLVELNKETEYALHAAGVETPRYVEKIADDVDSVILVDHNEFQQSVDNIKELTISEVIDHHRIANFETKDPLYFRAEPVGCTATILTKIFKEKQVEISATNAKLLVSAIISDTLLFKSPT